MAKPESERTIGQEQANSQKRKITRREFLIWAIVGVGGISAFGKGLQDLLKLAPQEVAEIEAFLNETLPLSEEEKKAAMENKNLHNRAVNLVKEGNTGQAEKIIDYKFR